MSFPSDHVFASIGRFEAPRPITGHENPVLSWLGLPQPVRQPVTVDEHGTAVARLDSSWDEFGVAGEDDGRSKDDGTERVLVAGGRFGPADPATPDENPIPGTAQSRPASRMPLSVGLMTAVGRAPSLTASTVFRPSPVL
ncbi:hypothetical protein SAMN05443575_3500 [Jatrophihabitans endophyticus]|uniref:Uncharacterized protein n=1 Tax=Jatrophihabitans endophyticus TaxID=1206085 RepID=A0A1M5RBV5_9ACTN|nr:hypothetical protein SAMN05443575_3500 [Jatrophihabitans endophyticus]